MMATAVIMPKAGMAMEEGTVIKWFKKEGDQVEQGEPLLEILTDKVNMEVEAQTSGTLIKIVKQEGQVVPVTNVIGYIGAVGEQVEDTIKSIEDVSKEEISENKGVSQGNKKLEAVIGKQAATPAARRIANEKDIDLSKIRGSGSFGEIKVKDVLEYKNVSITPLARRMAEENELNIGSMTGSGFDGKIVKQDIESLLTLKEEKPKIAGEKFSRRPLKGIRKIIAERMLQSHIEIPSVTLHAKADVTELTSIREKLNKTIDIKLTYNDFVLKAAACALKEFPNVNASLMGEEILYKEEINIGMAVALEDGLIVPVIKGAEDMSIKKISIKAKELSGKAREGKLMPDDMIGGTFTVSNLGMYDIVSFTPIINQPESAILGVCAIEEELRLSGEKIEARKIMGLSLTFDHRVIDGASGAIFLRRIKTLLENPLEMLI